MRGGEATPHHNPVARKKKDRERAEEAPTQASERAEDSDRLAARLKPVKEAGTSDD